MKESSLLEGMGSMVYGKMWSVGRGFKHGLQGSAWKKKMMMHEGRGRRAELQFFSSSGDGGEKKSWGFSSWMERMKGVFTRTAPQEEDQQPPNNNNASPHIPLDFNLMSFADHMKKARQYGNLIKFGKGLPRGGESSLARSLEIQEEIVRALASHDPTGQHLNMKQKSDVATKLHCTVKDVDDVLGKYKWMRGAVDRMQQLQKEGKPLPKTWNEVENLMGGSFKPDASRNLAKLQEISRNAPCPCGSGKKYKRCCLISKA